MSCLAIIPARGGSKRIPRKNIALVAGKPLIAWAIENAQQTKGVDRIVVSTDDLEIAEVSKKWGAEVPFIRPEEYARDETPGTDVILHAVRWLEENENYRPTSILLLQPTSPLREVEDIEKALELLNSGRTDSVVSVCPVHQHPYWMKKLDAEGRMSPFVEVAKEIDRRQDLPPVYGLNGAIYLVTRDALMNGRSFYTPNTLATIMPEEHSLDMDTEWDLHVADLILKARLTR